MRSCDVSISTELEISHPRIRRIVAGGWMLRTTVVFKRGLQILAMNWVLL